MADPELKCRRVRQGSGLWDILHAGLQTPSRLNGALGLSEPASVEVLFLAENACLQSHASKC